METQERGFGIYGWPQTEHRQLTWGLMEQIAGGVRDAWVCISDFNEIL